MVGGGFGGSAVVLVDTELTDTVAQAISEPLRAAGLLPPARLRGRAVPGAQRLA
jgi:galactokinase